MKNTKETHMEKFKWFVVWVRMSTEKENNVRYIILLKLFIFPRPFAFQTLAKHYLLCLVCFLLFFFFSLVYKLTFLIVVFSTADNNPHL